MNLITGSLCRRDMLTVKYTNRKNSQLKNKGVAGSTYRRSMRNPSRCLRNPCGQIWLPLPPPPPPPAGRAPPSRDTGGATPFTWAHSKPPFVTPGMDFSLVLVRGSTGPQGAAAGSCSAPPPPGAVAAILHAILHVTENGAVEGDGVLAEVRRARDGAYKAGDHHNNRTKAASNRRLSRHL